MAPNSSEWCITCWSRYQLCWRASRIGVLRVEIVEWETNQSLFPVGPKWGQVSTQCFPYRCHRYRKHRNFHSIHHIPIIQNMGWSSGKTEAILNSFLALFHNIDVVTATATTMTTVKFDYNAVNAKLCPPLQLFGYLCGAAEKDFIPLWSRPALHCTRFCEKDDLEVECEALFRSFTKFDLHI